MKQKFTVNGVEVYLDKPAVYAALKGQHPRRVGQQRYLVKVRLNEWSAVQALETAARANGWDSRKSVPTSEAVRVMESLGFQIIDQKDRERS